MKRGKTLRCAQPRQARYRREFPLSANGAIKSGANLGIDHDVTNPTMTASELTPQPLSD